MVTRILYPIWMFLFGRKSPYQPDKKIGPPENGIVRLLRKLMPYIAGLDYLIIAVIIVRLVTSIFMPETARFLDNQLIWFFQVFPTGGVILTGVIAAGLITSRLSSLESDTADIGTIKDKGAQAERRAFLDGQIKVCKDQRKQAIFFIVGYVILVATPEITGLDIHATGGRLLALALIVGEMLVPLLNMRTFSIVEASMIKIDVISNVIYEASNAAMQMLGGIGDRAKAQTLSKQDLRALRRGRKGDIDGMLQRRQENSHTTLDGKKYVSLRQAITGVRDGNELDELAALRYKKALAVARRLRDNLEAAKERAEQMAKAPDAANVAELEAEAKRCGELLQQFHRGAHNQLMVTEEMAGRIADTLAEARIRKPRSPNKDTRRMPAGATEATPGEPGADAGETANGASAVEGAALPNAGATPGEAGDGSDPSEVVAPAA